MRLSITYPGPNSPDFLLFVLCVPYGSSSSTAGAAIIHSQQDVRAVHHPAIALHHAMGRIMIVQTNPLITAGQNILIFPLGRMRPALRLIRARLYGDQSQRRIFPFLPKYFPCRPEIYSLAPYH